VLEQGGDICLITADAVERFGQNDLEQSALGVLQQCLDAGSQNHACARDSAV
jgi:hypothetical protein